MTLEQTNGNVQKMSKIVLDRDIILNEVLYASKGETAYIWEDLKEEKQKYRANFKNIVLLLDKKDFHLL